MGAGILTEIVITTMFLLVIMGATHHKAPPGFAPIAIGLALTLIHLTGYKKMPYKIPTLISNQAGKSRPGFYP